MIPPSSGSGMNTMPLFMRRPIYKSTRYKNQSQVETTWGEHRLDRLLGLIEGSAGTDSRQTHVDKYFC